LNAAVALRKASGAEAEKIALANTTVSSDSGKLGVHFAVSEGDFESLIKSPLFQGMVH
jgi:ABC-type tungstate transport system permease subunit